MKVYGNQYGLNSPRNILFVDGAISPEQAVKLRQCLAHINELEAHRNEIEQEILLIAEPFSAVLDLLYTLLGLDKNPMTAIAIFSEIGPDMSVFPSSKNLVSWAVSSNFMLLIHCVDDIIYYIGSGQLSTSFLYEILGTT